MKEYLGIAIRALVITAAASLIGLAVNLVSPKGISLLYAPPKEVLVAGVKIPLIDEIKAYEYYKSGEALFLDARKEDDFADGHVKGAIFFPEPEKEERYAQNQALMPEEAVIILYCSGPECDMAEKTAEFLTQLGYKKLMIMSAGFPGWKGAGYPIEASKDRK
jgi:rhodanese-related sulfurtransferase